MKVLFLNNYRSGTGYGNAGLDLILALDSAGVDVVPRNLDIAGNSHPVPPRIQELEKKSDARPDIILTFSLPHFFKWTPRAKNIGMFSYETGHLRNSSWPRFLNMMDQVFVINNQMVEACTSSGVTVPIKVVPHCADITKFQRSYPEFKLPVKDFIFYWIGELSKRKNLPAFLTAFHNEFNREPVTLLIKTHVPGMNSADTYNLVANKCNEIKHGIKKYWTIDKYKPEMIITDRISDEQMQALHRRCDCFVSTSHGEAWNLECLDAMGHGKPVIVSDNTGHMDYVPSEQRVECKPVSCSGMVNTFQDLYCGNEKWWEIDTIELQKKMRKVYEDEQWRKTLGLKNMNVAFRFSHQVIGLRMKKYLEEVLKNGN